MSVLIAVDKFKGSLSQSEIIEVVSNFLSHHQIEHSSVHIADGGDGSIDALTQLGWQRKTMTVSGPLNNEHKADYAVSPDGNRVAVEVAEICGIKYLQGNLKPYLASSRGVGEALSQILPSNFQEILICVGGSASIDGGMGILQGMGISVLDRNGKSVQPGLAGLEKAFEIDFKTLISKREELFGDSSLKVLSDTSFPLLGIHGAARSFGRQKGLTRFGQIRAELALRRWFRISKEFNPQIEKKKTGTGSAGGIGFAMNTFFGANIESGSDFFVAESRVGKLLTEKMTLITGEGRIDSTTLSGKTLLPLLKLARERNSRVLLLCGSADATTLRYLRKEFPIVGVVKLSNSGEGIEVLMNRAREILAEQLDSSYQKGWFA